MFGLNMFTEMKQKAKSPLFKTRDDVLKHWNLVHLGNNKYRHASGTGHIFDEYELTHMQRHGVMYDPDSKVRAHYEKIEKEESDV